MAKNQALPGQKSAETPPMKVDVKIGSIMPSGAIRATASVNLNDCFAIRGIRLLESEKGMYIGMPSYKAGNGEYKDICFPITAEFRKQLQEAVIEAYEQSLIQTQNAGIPDGPKDNMQMAPAGQAM